MSVQNSIRETSIMLSFSSLPDPRKDRNQEYSLFEIVTIAILGILCGADDWVSVSLWARSNQSWLQQFDICTKGVPSHDTLNRFFRFVDPTAFEQCFISWTQKVCKAIGGVIALDGKVICNSYDKSKNAKAIHLVSAFSSQNDLVLGQLATQAKSNEITAFPILIEMLDLKDSVVTIDAAGCQKDIVNKIRNKGGDYVLALKKNQGSLYAEAENYFTQAIEVSPKDADCDFYFSEERSRGRIEKREIWATQNLDWLPQISEWKDLRCLVCVRSTRILKSKEAIELRYYISSLQNEAQRHGQVIRHHWGIENKLHWQLDVSYREDECKIRKDHGAENFSILRRATLNLLKGDKKTKAGIKNKRLKAGWDKEYMVEILKSNC